MTGQGCLLEGVYLNRAQNRNHETYGVDVGKLSSKIFERFRFAIQKKGQGIECGKPLDSNIGPHLNVYNVFLIFNDNHKDDTTNNTLFLSSPLLF